MRKRICQRAVSYTHLDSKDRRTLDRKREAERGKVQGMHEKLQMCRMGADHQDPLSAEDVPPEAGKEDHSD